MSPRRTIASETKSAWLLCLPTLGAYSAMERFPAAALEIRRPEKRGPARAAERLHERRPVGADGIARGGGAP